MFDPVRPVPGCYDWRRIVNPVGKREREIYDEPDRALAEDEDGCDLRDFGFAGNRSRTYQNGFVCGFSQGVVLLGIGIPAVRLLAGRLGRLRGLEPHAGGTRPRQQLARWLRRA